MSQLHTSMNNIIAEWIVTATSTVTTYPIVISIIIIHISALMQFMLKQKRNIWIITGKYSFIQA